MANYDDAKRQQELNNAKSLKQQYESQRQAYQSRLDSNNNKLARIRSVKKEIRQIKDSVEERAQAQKKHAENQDTYYQWNGDKQGKVQDMYAQVTPVEYNYYVYAVDNLLDSIVDLETQYENDNLKMLGLIGEIGGWINSLEGKIEKLLN